MKTYKEIPSLLSKVLLGTLSEEEAYVLRQWREESSENERLYESVMNAEYMVQKSREVANVDIVNGYMNVVQKRKRNARVRRIHRIVSIAAGVVLPLLAVVLWYGARQKLGDVPGSNSGSSVGKSLAIIAFLKPIFSKAFCQTSTAYFMYGFHISGNALSI